MPANWSNGRSTRRRLLAGTAALSSGVLVGAATATSDPAPASASAGAVRHRRREHPRNRLTRAVDELLVRTSPLFLVEHCRRSFALALLIAEARDVAIDVEVVYAGVHLHDLGLTERFHSPDVRFEVASANAARDLVRAHGMSPWRADNVWDVAALHGTGGISGAKSPETAIGSSGIVADVTGLGLDSFDPEVIAAIMATRPGFARPFIDAIVADLQDKPDVASGTWMGSIAADHIPGFHQSSIEQIALADPFENPS